MTRHSAAAVRARLAIASAMAALAACTSPSSPSQDLRSPQPSQRVEQPRAPIYPDATTAEIVGRFRVTAIYSPDAYYDDYWWPVDTSPIAVAIDGASITLESVCARCVTAASVSPGVVTPAPLACQRLTCPGGNDTPDGTGRAIAVLSHLLLATRPELGATSLVLSSKAGRLDLVRDEAASRED